MSLTTKGLCGKSCRRGVKKIYLDAFPREDRMPFFMMCLMSLLPTTRLLAYYDGAMLCGFTYYAVLGRQIFLMFFAVDEALRGKGYGSKILSELKVQNPKRKLIVSIEPCGDGEDEDINRRRKNFYQRNGFAETGYMIRLGKVQEILIANGSFSKAALRLFLGLYSLFTLWPKIFKK